MLWELGTRNSLIINHLPFGNVFSPLPGNGKLQGGKVWAHNATTRRLALARTLAALAEAGHTLLEKKLDAVIAKNPLLHGEALLVVATGDPEDVALELISQTITCNFCSHPFVIEGQQFLVILNLKDLLHAGGWAGNVDLHGV